jgi:hypothetical protein
MRCSFRVWLRLGNRPRRRGEGPVDEVQFSSVAWPSGTCEGIAHEAHATPVPSRAQDPLEGGRETVMGIPDDERHALEPTPDELAQEGRLKRLGVRAADAQSDDLAPAVGVDRHGDDRRHRDDPTALAQLQVGGIEPPMRPLASRGPLPKGECPLVEPVTELGDLALGDSREPMACTRSSTRGVETAAIGASCMTGRVRRSCGPRGRAGRRIRGAASGS